MELSLMGHPQLLYQRLLNEGALHFVREDIECIEREIRLQFCFVIDVDARMLIPPADLHPSFGKGMTPYIRARVLASLLLMDLARYLPRENVRADAAVFLWSSQAPNTYRNEFDLFAVFSRETASRRFTFAGAFAEQVPYLFRNSVPDQAGAENQALDRDPCQYLVHRNQSRVYHCRHLLFFTSEHSARQAFPETDPALDHSEHGRDSLFVISCDVHQPTIGVMRPRLYRDAADGLTAREAGQLNEERLRAHVVETVLLKLAGRVTRLDEGYELSELS
jgi:hypothetical protein